MKLRFVSDGTPGGTRVENAETGELLQNVTEISVFVAAMDVPRARINVLMTEFDVTADVERIVICPMCKREISAFRRATPITI